MCGLMSDSKTDKLEKEEIPNAGSRITQLMADVQTRVNKGGSVVISGEKLRNSAVRITAT